MLDQMQFDTEEAAHAESSEYDRLRDMLENQVSGFADEHQVSFDTLSLLLIDCGVTNALTRYLLSVDKPSAYGLKLELDRLRRKIENFIRLHKGDADDFMRESKEWIEEWRAEAATALGARMEKRPVSSPRLAADAF
jgi:hypothetical protein